MKKISFLLIPVAILLGCDNKLSSEPAKISAPFQVALTAMGQDFQSELTSLVITQNVFGESPTEATVEIEQKGLFDDSTQAIKTLFRLSSHDGHWTIDEENTEQKCYEGRGHQDYSADLCL